MISRVPTLSIPGGVVHELPAHHRPGGRPLRIASYFGEWPVEPAHASRVTACLRARGFDARLVPGMRVTEKAGRRAPDGPDVGPGTFDEGRAVARVSGDLASHRPDILHCWSAEANVIGGLAALRAAVPRIVLTLGAEGLAEGCSDGRPELTLEWYRILARQERVRLLADRPAVAEAYSRLLDVPLRHIHVIDPGFFRYLSRNQEVDGHVGVDLLALLYYRLWPRPDAATRVMMDAWPHETRQGPDVPRPEAAPARTAGHEVFPTFTRRLLRRATDPVLVLGRTTHDSVRDWLDAAAAENRRLFVLDAGLVDGGTDDYLAFCRSERPRLSRLVVHPWRPRDVEWGAGRIGLLVLQLDVEAGRLKADFDRCQSWLSPSCLIAIEGYDPRTAQEDPGRTFVEQDLLRHGVWRWEQFEAGRLVVRRVAADHRYVVAHNHRSLERALGVRRTADCGPPVPIPPAA